MRKGKMIAQGAHACLNSFQLATKFGYKSICHDWEQTGQTKICVGVTSEAELVNIYKEASDANIPCSLIKDAGRTEFKEPTLTAVAIGPWHSNEIDKITGKLKLL